MDGESLLLIVLILIAIGIGVTGGKRGGVIVKDNPASQKPKIGAAPQPLKSKIRKNKKI